MTNSSIAAKYPDLRGTVRRGALLTLLSGIIVLCSLAYGAYQIHLLDQKLAWQREQSVLLDKDIAEKQTKVTELDKRVADLNYAVSLIPPEQFKKAVADSPAAASRLPARVYIHISSEDQRATADRAAASLRAAGYIVPGIEYVGSRAPKYTQVRYFERSDEGGQDLPGILRAMGNAGIEAHGQYIPMPPSSTARPRHFELWFGTGS